MIIGVMAELLQAGIDPINTIKSGIEILEEKQRNKYLDLMSGKKIVNQDYLSGSINLILNSFFYPHLLQYQWGNALVKEAKEKKWDIPCISISHNNNICLSFIF
jgi:hypothetical protein